MMKLQTREGGTSPSQDDAVIFGDVFVTSQMLIDMSLGMVGIWDQRERPSSEDVFAVPYQPSNSSVQETFSVSFVSFYAQERASPHRIVNARVLNSSCITLLDYITMDVLHEQIGREHAMHEIFANILVVEIVLKKRGNLFQGETRTKVDMFARTDLNRAYVDRTIDKIIANFDLWTFCQYLTRDRCDLGWRVA
jgi:hypothetical protein